MDIKELNEEHLYNQDYLDAILTDLTIITGVNGKVIEKGEIHIKDGVIKYAGEKPKKEELKTKARYYYGGALCLPAYVNTHTHLPMNLFRGCAEDMVLGDWLTKRIFPLEDKLSGDAVYWATKLAAIESLSCGVATVNDMYFFTEDMLRALKELNLRSFISKTIVNSPNDIKLKEAVEAVEEIRSLKDPLIYGTICPHAQYTVSESLMENIAAAAKDLNALVHIHVSETEAEHEECKRQNGVTPMELINRSGILDSKTIAAHCVFVEKDDIEIMKEHGVSVASCPVSNLKLGSGIAPLNEFRKAGLNVAIGTDGAASNNALSVLSEMRLAALLQKGTTHDASVFDKEYALATGTINGAKALGIDNITGTIEAGKQADLVIYSQFNLKASPGIDKLYDVLYAYEDSYVLATYVAGTLAYERRDGSNICRINGRDGEIDVHEVMAKVREYTKDICMGQEP
ncbi:MAG: amidohydrolase [Eubacteriales bacterium]